MMTSGIIVNGVEIFLLVFVRMTGLFVVAPLFGRRNIPSYFKVGLSLLMALILVNTLQFQKIDFGDNWFSYGALMGVEFIVGLVIGYTAYIVFSGIYMAGQLIDTQIGFGIVSVIDPMSNIQVPMSSNFYIIVSTLIMLILNGHHAMILALFESYKYVPIGGAHFVPQLLDELTKMMANVFILGFKIAAPVTATILISDVTLGIMSKAIPQLNVFVVGMPLKIGIGLAVMVLTIAMFTTMASGIVTDMAKEMATVMVKMGGG